MEGLGPWRHAPLLLAHHGTSQRAIKQGAAPCKRSSPRSLHRCMCSNAANPQQPPAARVRRRVTPRCGAVDNDFRYRRCLPAYRCCLHTHTSRKSTPLCRIVMTALDPAARARPDRAILGWCGSRAGVRRARRLDVNPSSLWTASGPLMRPAAADAARWRSICWMSARERRTPARRRLCATSARFPDQDATDRVRRRVMGQHKAHTSNTRAGSTMVGQAYRIRSKTGQSRARSRRHDDPGETDGQDQGSEAATRPDLSLLLPELRADANLHQQQHGTEKKRQLFSDFAPRRGVSVTRPYNTTRQGIKYKPAEHTA
jgi:hypothetical protein